MLCQSTRPFHDVEFVDANQGTCHATDGPPKMGPPGPSAAKNVAVDGPPNQVWLP